MKIILLINAIILMIIGISLIMRPDMIFWSEEIDNTAYNISKMYGMAATIIGAFSFLISKYGKDVKLIRLSAITAIAFHLILTFHLYGIYRSGLLHEIGIFILHLAITIILLIIYIKNI